MLTQTELIAAIDDYLARSGETAASFGRRVANDSRLVSDLKAGRSPTLRIVAAILEGMEKQ